MQELSHEEWRAALAKNQAQHTAAVKKEQRRICRNAIKNGGTVPYDLRTLIELRISNENIRRIYRGS